MSSTRTSSVTTDVAWARTPCRARWSATSAPATAPSSSGPVSGLHRQDGHALGALQERQRVVDRARRLAAGIPRDEHAPPNGLKEPDVRHHQRRPSRTQDHALGKVAGRPRSRAVGIALADDGEIGIPGVEAGRLAGIALVERPSVAMGKPAAATRSRNIAAAPSAASRGALVHLAHLGGQLGEHRELERQRHPDVEPGQVRVEVAREPGGEVDALASVAPVIHQDQQVLECHGAASSRG